MTKAHPSPSSLPNKSKVDRPKPTINGISEKELPEIKNWKVGGTYTMTVQVEMTGARKGQDWDVPYSMSEGGKRPEVLTADFKIIDIPSAKDEELDALKEKYGPKR